MTLRKAGILAHAPAPVQHWWIEIDKEGPARDDLSGIMALRGPELINRTALQIFSNQTILKRKYFFTKKNAEGVEVSDGYLLRVANLPSQFPVVKGQS